MDTRGAMGRLSGFLKSQGYYRKGKAFFKLQGDGVLIVITMEYERVTGWHTIHLGLFSLYGEILPQWLTAGGCIARYWALLLHDRNYYKPITLRQEGEWLIIGYPDAEITRLPNDGLQFASPTVRRKALEIYTAKLDPLQQVETFISYVFPILQNIHTQMELYDVILRYDTRSNDDLKIAPLLVGGRYADALDVVNAILAQNRNAFRSNGIPVERWNDNIWYSKMLQVEQIILEEVGISAYLSENFTRNIELFSNTFGKKKNQSN